MSTPTSHDGGAGSASVGVGTPNDSRTAGGNSEGSQRETGGSGGDQLTGNQDGRSGQPAQPRKEPAGKAGAAPASADDKVMDSGARGAQDTRSQQATPPGTGLGSPETGANQASADMDRKP